jgi:Ca2+-binding RTX toxin-like protein
LTRLIGRGAVMPSGLVVMASVLVMGTVGPAGATSVFSDGFESGTLSAWTSSLGMTVQSTDVFTGGFAAEATAVSGRAYAQKTLSVPVQGLSLAAAFKLVSQGPNSVVLLRFQTAAPANIATLFLDAPGNLMLRNDAQGSTLWSSTIVQPGAWREVEVRLEVAGPASHVEVLLDGSTVAALSTTLALGGDPIARIIVGDNVPGRTFQVRFDDVGAATLDTEPPSPPANLHMTNVTSTQVDLAWNPSNDNVGVTGYEVHRDGALLASIGDETSYTDGAVASSTTYEYKVRARDSADNVSAFSNEVAVTTPAGPQPCAFDPSLKVVTVTLGFDATHSISVSGSSIVVDGATCGAATVTNTDRIDVDDVSIGGSGVAVIDLAGGSFQPGATDEPGSSDEIEFVVDLGDGPADRLEVRGSPAGEWVVVGTLGANLNLGEPDGVDVDLTASGVEGWLLDGRSGNDRLSAWGGGATGAPVSVPVTVLGGSGADRLTGGAAGDYFDGGDGFDTLDESARTVPLTITVGNNLANDGASGEGDNVAGTVEAVLGGVASDVISGDDGADLLRGGDGNDVLNGNGGDDDLRGESGNDTLNGGANDDQVVGGDGDDVENGQGFSDLFIQGAQAIYESPNPAAAMADTGSTMSSFTVSGVASGRMFDVDIRIDIEHPNSQHLRIAVISPLGTYDLLFDHRGNGSPMRGTVFDSDGVTNIRFLGSKPLEGRFHPEWSMELLDGQDVNGTWTLEIIDDAPGSAGVLNGWSVIAMHGTTLSNGNDVISGGSGNRDLIDYSGRQSPLVVTMQSGADDGQAGESDNVGSGLADIEDMYAGNGDDNITGTDNPIDWNEIRGGAGNDVVAGLGGDDNLRGQDGTDTLLGGDGTDTLQGNPGNDSLDGGPGTDWITFGAAPASVTANLSSGTATGDGTDTILSVENLIGSRFGDGLTGNGLGNVLEGRAGNDALSGLAGNDRLDGGIGTDSLDGGSGTDICLAGETVTGCEG